MGFASFHAADFKFDAPAPGQPLEEQLAAWAREAAAARRVACVYLTASWCPPSVLLEKSLTNPLMAKALRGVNFVTYDIDDVSNELQAAGFPAHTVPVFFVIDQSGKRTGPMITGGAWGQNTPENMAPPLERFFDAARAEIAASPAVGGMPDPQVIAQMMAANSAARPAEPVAPQQQPAPPPPALVAASPVAPTSTSSKMPMLLVAGLILLALAIAFFAKS